MNYKILNILLAESHQGPWSAENSQIQNLIVSVFYNRPKWDVKKQKRNQAANPRKWLPKLNYSSIEFIELERNGNQPTSCLNPKSGNWGKINWPILSGNHNQFKSLISNSASTRILKDKLMYQLIPNTKHKLQERNQKRLCYMLRKTPLKTFWNHLRVV